MVYTVNDLCHFFFSHDIVNWQKKFIKDNLSMSSKNITKMTCTHGITGVFISFNVEI